MAIVPAVVLGVYYGILTVLALYGVHRAVLLARWRRTRRLACTPPPWPDPPPRVTVQLPLYNERFVAERLLRAVAGLDYPRDRLEVQVLDDSTDDTSDCVAGVVAELVAAGLDIRHTRRRGRAGYKAGALAAGMQSARGELLCIFDADFVPPADFLRRTVPWFADPAIGMVQARWDHLNRSDSLLTEAQAVLLDGHFVIEHAARERGGCFFNFNGTAGVWRREAIRAAGGWQSDTLTEDLDLSYRAQLAGWRFLFLPDLAAPAELPGDIDAFKGQQHRWARGSVQTARKLLPALLRARLPWRVKLEALVHLTHNASYPLMMLLAALVFPAMLLRRGAAAWQIAAIDLPLFAAATLSVLAFYAASQVTLEQRGRRFARFLPAVLATGIGLSASNTAAVLGGLVRRGGVFERTPKVPAEGSRRVAAGFEYRATRRGSVMVEVGLAAYFLVAIGAAARLGMWSSLPFLLLFLHGYGYFSWLAIGPLRAWRGR
jgi:cellulose synthase/poly-beta-1,6-N-acetylglucosamine synthase-like glycosyltransferase